MRIANAQGIDETPNGALVVLVAKRRVFIPTKLIDDDSEVWKPDTEGVLVIPTWLAEDKGLYGDAVDDDQTPDLVDMMEGRSKR